jgi:hypothetical protein
MFCIFKVETFELLGNYVSIEKRPQAGPLQQCGLALNETWALPAWTVQAHLWFELAWELHGKMTHPTNGHSASTCGVQRIAVKRNRKRFGLGLDFRHWRDFNF